MNNTVFENIQEVFDTFTKIWQAMGVPISGIDRAVVQKLIKSGDNDGALKILDSHQKRVIGSGINYSKEEHKLVIDTNLLMPNSSNNAKVSWDDNSTFSWGGFNNKNLWNALAPIKKEWNDE